MFQDQRKRISGVRVAILAKEAMLMVYILENLSRKQVQILRVSWLVPTPLRGLIEDEEGN